MISSPLDRAIETLILSTTETTELKDFKEKFDTIRSNIREYKKYNDTLETVNKKDVEDVKKSKSKTYLMDAIDIQHIPKRTYNEIYSSVCKKFRDYMKEEKKIGNNEIGNNDDPLFKKNMELKKI